MYVYMYAYLSVLLKYAHTYVCENMHVLKCYTCPLQGIFDGPDLKRGAILNKDAAKMLQLTPHTYRQMALDCVTASLRVQS